MHSILWFTTNKLIERIRQVDPDQLVLLKKALTDFNARRKRWDCPPSARVRSPEMAQRASEPDCGTAAPKVFQRSDHDPLIKREASVNLIEDRHES